MVSNHWLRKRDSKLTNEMQAKDRILIAARELFSKKGYEQVTVREIAKKANCSHTSIYVFLKINRSY